MFSVKDIAEYYDTTQVHYKKWWNLKKSLSLHYGIWTSQTRSFPEALENTNRIMMEAVDVPEKARVLDAGCGVGGAAFFLHKHRKARVTGITISKEQLQLAQESARQLGLSSEAVNFLRMDYTQTDFDNDVFDVVWACESSSSALDKSAFIRETARVLKRNGRLILSDFFLSDQDQKDPRHWMKKWGETWGISSFVSTDSFSRDLRNAGFSRIEVIDYTDQIHKSARRMYLASIIGMIPSEIYNALHADVSRFARTHYKCGYYQYMALKEHLWKYKVILAEK